MIKNIIMIFAVTLLFTLSALSANTKQNHFSLDIECAEPLLLPISYTQSLGTITAGYYLVPKSMESYFTLYADGNKTWTVHIIKNGEPVASGGGHISLESEWQDEAGNPLVITAGSFQRTPYPHNCNGESTFKIKVFSASADANVLPGTFTFVFSVSVDAF
jgi:hypothetical protein